MRTRLYRCLVLLLLGLPASRSANGDTLDSKPSAWGSLKGQFVVTGSVPSPPAHPPGNDPVCHAAKPVDESVLVNERGGLKNAVVFLRPPRGATLPIHPAYQAAFDKPLVISNRQCAFTPRVNILRTGQPLVLKNADPTAHNTKLDLVRNTAINQVIPEKSAFTTKLATPERAPTPLSCNIHPFMRGYVLVREDPYAAVSDADGRFLIENLPAGEHEFQLWHETGSLKNLPLAAGETDRRGRVRLTIPASGELDLGEVRVPADMLLDRR